MRARRILAAAALGAPLAIAALVRFPLAGEIAVGQPQWFWRAELFWSALERFEPSGTLLAPHPGLTVLWIAGAAQKLASAETKLEQAVASSWGVATVNLLILAIALWTLLHILESEDRDGPAQSVLAIGLMLALDPILIPMTGLVGLDGLLSLLVLAALLSIYSGLKVPSRGRWIGTAALAGLATATKGAALLLLPAPYLAAAQQPALGRTRWRRASVLTVAMVIGSALVVFALLPAAWVDAPRVANRLLLGDAGTRESLLGVLRKPRVESLLPYPDAPGILAYLVHLLFRSTPLALAGTVIGFASRSFRRDPLVRYLGIFGIGYVAVLGIVPQKEWRYVLPAIVLMDVVGALGLVHLSSAIRETSPRARRAWLAPAAIVLQGLWVVAAAPYYEFRMNPILGGLPAASRWIPIGWGAGLERAQEFLNSEAARRGRILTWSGGYGFSGYRDRKGLEFEGSGTRWLGQRARPGEADCYVSYARTPAEHRAPLERQWEEIGELSYELRIDGVPITRVWCRDEPLSSERIEDRETPDQGGIP